MTPSETKKMSGNEIREMFLRFFESKGHRRVRSSSLVPHGDPTLLFTNAGMNQFKDVFLGLEKRDYNKATTAQKCVRAGGKHNDLENVGFTRRHLTFFEMLGNFSFGDYFKRDAIKFAWELVTSPEWMGIPQDRLYVTIFEGADGIPRDDEAEQYWLEVGVPKDRILAMGPKENFWQMGDTGPCGPCSEIIYERTEVTDYDKNLPFGEDDARYVEIWNLVFMQFDRSALVDPATKATTYKLTPLPKPSIDTGMGLERITTVLQGVMSIYDTDLFVPLVKRAAELCGVDFQREEKLEEGKGGAASLRVVADHARATTFLISDGVLPSNEGRGYVLRKIIRRAISHGRFLGNSEPFLYRMVEGVVALMSEAYPELLESAARVSKVTREEERRFSSTLDAGLRKMEPLIKDARPTDEETLQQQLVYRDGSGGELRGEPDERRATARALLSTSDREARLRILTEHFEPLIEGFKSADVQREDLQGENMSDVLSTLEQGVLAKPVLRGEDAFKLYDTYGLPADFMMDAANDKGVFFDLHGFFSAMEEQRKRARASWKKGAPLLLAVPAYSEVADRFKTQLDFYHDTSAKDCRIEAIIVKTDRVSELRAGQEGDVFLDRTVIYAESGGQMADTGAFYDNSGAQLLAEVTGAYYPVAGLVAHRVNAKETLRVGDRVSVMADAERHARIIRNHSGTHLVHAALRNILGTHVKQAGSLNAPERLRFDFSHFAHVDAEELKDIEQQVNDEIRHNTEIGTEITSLDNALASGALAFFGDKYPEADVRVVTIPDERSPRGFYSKELCGGTHVHRIGDIGVLKIVSEGSVAAGVRRIEAVTGIGALEHYEKQAQILSQVASRLNTSEDSVLATVEKLSATVKQLEKELEGQRRKGALGQLDQLAGQVQTIKGVRLIAAEVAGTDKESLRQLVDSLRQKIGSGVVALGTVDDGKVALIAGVTKDLTAKVHAGKLIQALAKMVGGSGGGRPDLAEAGGKDTAALKNALSTIPALLEPLL
ncbi:MAG TPA: alanine--tRNA ligase [Candidatus Acidoferrum sp.]|nr:alanine--tRNA ligase [Candidatus Acidoferrum sp.]